MIVGVVFCCHAVCSRDGAEGTNVIVCSSVAHYTYCSDGKQHREGPVNEDKEEDEGNDDNLDGFIK